MLEIVEADRAFNAFEYPRRWLELHQRLYEICLVDAVEAGVLWRDSLPRLALVQLSFQG